METLTHQKWNNEIVDEMGNIVFGGTPSTGIIETQFGKRASISLVTSIQSPTFCFCIRHNVRSIQHACAWLIFLS